MKKNIVLLMFGLLTTLAINAQTIYDGVNLSAKDLNGTARFVGMGGAMGALGGDISTINTNPAGIGIYRSSEVNATFGFSSYATGSDYQGNQLKSKATFGDLDNLGFVLSTQYSTQKILRYINFGFNYQRVKSFNRNMQMKGNLGDFSQTFYMANQAYGITDWNNSYTNSEIGWLYVPYKVNGVQVKDVNGQLMYVTPGDYVGMYSGADVVFKSQERGGIDALDFNVSLNLSDRFYLGMTVSAYTVDYSKYSIYGEDYRNDEWYKLQTWSKIEGAGFDIKLGAIFRPVETLPLRIGLAVHTPTFYDLSYKTSAVLDADVWNYLAIENEGKVPADAIGQYTIDTYDKVGDDMTRKFHLETPWTYNLSLGYTVGSSLALGAEYEYKDYSTMLFDDGSNFYDGYQFENETTNMLKGTSTIRLGAEYKVIPQMALRLGYNYCSTIFEDNAYKNLPINSIQTDTDFTNTESLSNYTLGIGYRGSMFYADLAYKLTAFKAKFYPFDTFDGESLVQATKLNNTRNQVLLTLGVRF